MPRTIILFSSKATSALSNVSSLMPSGIISRSAAGRNPVPRTEAVLQITCSSKERVLKRDKIIVCIEEEFLLFLQILQVYFSGFARYQSSVFF